MKNFVIFGLLILLNSVADAQTVTVAGAGDNVAGATTQVNGTYSFDGARNTSAGTYHDYERDGSTPSGGGGACLLIYFNNNNSLGTDAAYADKWIIINFCTGSFADEVRYFADELVAGAADPPETGWQVANGAAPAPTLSGSVSMLPIGLLHFAAHPEDERVYLQWQTAWELHNAYIAVERATDDHRFTEIGRLAGAGTTEATVDYRYVDLAAPGGVVYYRLRQVDYDGTATYHRTLAVRVAHAHAPRWWPTLAAETLYVAVGPNPWKGQLCDAQGRVLRVVSLSAEQTALLDVSDLASGTYYLRPAAGGPVMDFVRP